MGMAYSDPSRESDPHALPDVEVFQGSDYGDLELEADKWYWWACLPGCLPDSDPNGPFESEEAALVDAKGDECPDDIDARADAAWDVLTDGVA